MNLLDKLDYLCFERKLSKRQFALQANIPYTTIDGLYKRGYERMQLFTFVAICDFFGVTMDSMAKDDKEIVFVRDLKGKELTHEEGLLLEGYNMLSSEGKERVEYTLNAELEMSASRKLEKKDV